MALVVVATGMMLSVINVTIVNIALPAIARDFDADVSAVGWVVSGFLITQATLLLLAGRAGDLYGRRRVFVVGVCIVILASILCALAWSTASLVAFRIVQGVGACAMAPTAIGYVAETFPSRERGQAMGILAGVIGIAPVLALNLAGVLVGVFGWRSVFWFSPILGAVVLAGAALVLKPSTPSVEREPFDVPGALLIGAGLFSILLALSRGEAWGWTSPATISAGLVGVVGLKGFLLRERLARHPMLDLGLFRLRTVSTANAASLLSSSALFGSLILLPFYFTVVLGYDEQRVGLAITPVAASFVIVAPLAGRMVHRLGPGRIAGAGFALSAIGVVGMALAVSTERYVMVVPGMVAFAAGLAMAIAPMNTTAVHQAPPERLGVASSLPNIFRYTGGAIGSAVMLAVVHGRVPEAITRRPGRGTESERALLASGVSAALVVAIVALALAFGVSRLMPSRLVSAGPS